MRLVTYLCRKVEGKRLALSESSAAAVIGRRARNFWWLTIDDRAVHCSTRDLMALRAAIDKALR